MSKLGEGSQIWTGDKEVRRGSTCLGEQFDQRWARRRPGGWQRGVRELDAAAEQQMASAPRPSSTLKLIVYIDLLYHADYHVA